MKIIEVTTRQGYADSLRAAAEELDAEVLGEFQPHEAGEKVLVRILADDAEVQPVLDRLESLCGNESSTRVLVLPVEAALPRKETVDPIIVSRQSLFDQISRGAQLNGEFLLLVTLSTIVAAVGLVENNVAVVIGAMVIAPLLGPNLGLALAAALGDGRLMRKALATNLAGLTLGFSIAVAVGLTWPVDPTVPEIAARTDVSFASLLLATASGMAGVLSLTSGLAAVLVGVMVAVALLPPTTACGLLLGAGDYDGAMSAALLLATNIICVNLSAQLVFLARGVRPRTWLEQRAAKESVTLNIVFWGILMLGLIAIILLRQRNGIW
jgi:uncharacterized hydrophobic protein (TIGR00341 family)